MDGSMVSQALWNSWEQFYWNHKKENLRVKMDPDTQCKQFSRWSTMHNCDSCCCWPSRWICFCLLWSVDYVSLLPWLHSSEILKNLRAADKCESYVVRCGEHEIRPAVIKIYFYKISKIKHLCTSVFHLYLRINFVIMYFNFNRSGVCQNFDAICRKKLNIAVSRR